MKYPTEWRIRRNYVFLRCSCDSFCLADHLFQGTGNHPGTDHEVMERLGVERELFGARMVSVAVCGVAFLIDHIENGLCFRR